MVAAELAGLKDAFEIITDRWIAARREYGTDSLVDNRLWHTREYLAQRRQEVVAAAFGDTFAAPKGEL